MSGLSDRPMRKMGEDGDDAVQWPAMVDAVVADARQSFGDAIADELASLLLRHTAEANRALDESFAAADRGIAATRRQEAADLHRRASGTDAAAQAAMESLQVERATLQAQLAKVQAALDARETERTTREAELSRREERLTQRRPDTESTVAAEHQPRDNGSSDAQFRPLRAQWRTPADDTAVTGALRGWGRRGRSDDRSEPDAR